MTRGKRTFASITQVASKRWQVRYTGPDGRRNAANISPDVMTGQPSAGLGWGLLRVPGRYVDLHKAACASRGRACRTVAGARRVSALASTGEVVGERATGEASLPRKES
jgi:hypothetical protein